jgi:predicted metal-dependent hydrolase
MLDIVEIIIVLVLIIVIYKYFESKSYDVVFVKSSINSKEYLVRNLPDKQEAADLLGKISVKLEKLVNIMQQSGYETIFNKYLAPDLIQESKGDKRIDDSNQGQTDAVQPGNNALTGDLALQVKMTLKDDIARLVSNFNPDNFSETTPDAKYTSYSVNKGEKIVFCMRDKKTGENLVKENIMTFVAIHELGHLMTKSIGHEPEFWNNFKLLLKVAVDNELYKNVDFNNTPQEYCGVKITDTPLKTT